MSVLRQYWARLDNKRLRLVALAVLVAALLLVLNNPVGSSWNRVGMILDLVGLCVLAFGLPLKRR